MENLRQAEDYLDHIEAHGQSNTYEALKSALQDDEVDTIYFLSDGEPSMDTDTILADLKLWLKQRRTPCVIHPILFSMGNTSTFNQTSRQFMADIATMTGGVFRCMDPLAPLNQDLDDDTLSDAPDFSDDEFVDFLQERTRDIPQQLLKNVGLTTHP